MKKQKKIKKKKLIAVYSSGAKDAFSNFKLSSSITFV